MRRSSILDYATQQNRLNDSAMWEDSHNDISTNENITDTIMRHKNNLLETLKSPESITIEEL